MVQCCDAENCEYTGNKVKTSGTKEGDKEK